MYRPAIPPFAQSAPAEAADERWGEPRRHMALIGIVAALVLLLLIAVASYRSIEGFETRMRAVAHSHDVLASIEEMFANYAQARSSWWSYMASADDPRRDQFERTVASVEQSLDELLIATERPTQRARLFALNELVRGELAELRTMAATHDDGAFAPDADFMYDILLQFGRVRDLQVALVTAEREVLRSRQAESDSAGTAIRVALVGGYGLCFFMLAASLLYLHREASARRRAQRKVMDLNLALHERAGALQDINKELEDFSYSVSHDLRAPIRAISSFAHILEEEYGDRLDAEGLRLLAVVRGNSERMGRLIDDLLAFSRVGRQGLTSTQVDMNALVQEVIDGLRVDTRNMIRARFDTGYLPDIKADASLLRQVWTNLIDNALKYTSRSAEPLIRIRGKLNNGWAEYSIEDNGPGFDMQYADKLFEVFQRLHHAPEYPGTGVGLAIVKRIVDRHGGWVRAKSEPGNGACFTFALPAQGGGEHE